MVKKSEQQNVGRKYFVKKLMVAVLSILVLVSIVYFIFVNKHLKFTITINQNDDLLIKQEDKTDGEHDNNGDDEENDHDSTDNVGNNNEVESNETEAILENLPDIKRPSYETILAKVHELKEKLYVGMSKEEVFTFLGKEYIDQDVSDSHNNTVEAWGYYFFDEKDIARVLPYEVIDTYRLWERNNGIEVYIGFATDEKVNSIGITYLDRDKFYVTSFRNWGNGNIKEIDYKIVNGWKYSSQSILFHDHQSYVIEKLGKPNRIINENDKNKATYIYEFDNENSFVVKLFNGYVYGMVEYFSTPNTSSIDYMNEHGRPSEIREVSCYHSAVCEELIYRDKNKLKIVHLSWDDKVEFIKLLNRDYLSLEMLQPNEQ
jgi:hypothetical protein